MESKERLTYLLERLVDHTATPDELDELTSLISDDSSGQMLTQAEQLLAQQPLSAPVYDDEHWQRVADIILAADKTGGTSLAPVGRVRLQTRVWIRYAAAVLIIMLGTVAYLWDTPNKKTESYVQTNPSLPAPMRSRATITLANGQQIFIDSAMQGTIAEQGNVNIRKTSTGRIVYSGNNEQGEMQYNILTNPRGSQVTSMVLSDGSTVYLNAASSIKYPVAFNNIERKVEITGEAYFEVEKDPKRKFIVSNNELTTEVLGTHFNINAYSDEITKRVTLLEGSIRVNESRKSVVVKPGEQAVVQKEMLVINKSIDVEKVMAWKNGFFNFDRVDLPGMLRQISRWYDIDIQYKGKIPQREFGGRMRSDLNLREMLHLLDNLGVKYEIKEKTLFIE